MGIIPHKNLITILLDN
uniref:Uncharacterized protein n=1 Tax=Rhizophora mucronata TaxID=61149 RepID=A0A2P2PWK3_RHIMU